MKKYYYSSPRGFSNEFDIISVEQTDKKECMLFERLQKAYNESSNINWDLHQITAKRAQEIIRAERAIERSYKRAGLNTVCNPVGATRIITISEYYEYR